MLPNETFLNQGTIQKMQDLFQKIDPKGSLLVQTNSYVPGSQFQTALTIGNRSTCKKMLTDIERAKHILYSSRFLGIKEKYATGLRDVSHRSWVLTCRHSKGVIWICHQPASASVFSDGVMSCCCLLACLSKSDPELQYEYRSLEESIKTNYHEEYFGAAYKYYGATAMNPAILPTLALANATTAAS